MRVRTRIGLLIGVIMMKLMAVTSLLVGDSRTCFKLREGLIRANNSTQYDHDDDDKI